MRIDNGSIYKITNLKNGKLYIGLTRNTIEERFEGHLKSALIDNLDLLLSKAIRKYGQDNFTVELVKDGYTDTAELKGAEKFYIQMFQSHAFSEGHHGYNMTLGGDGSLGSKWTEEQKQRHSERNSGDKNGFYGKTHKEESLNLMKETKGNWTDEEKRRFSLKMSKARSGKSLSEEHKESIAKGNLRRFSDPEERRKISETARKNPEKFSRWKGKEFSDEHKKSISLGMKGIKRTKEHQEKLNESRKKPIVVLKDGTLVEKFKGKNEAVDWANENKICSRTALSKSIKFNSSTKSTKSYPNGERYIFMFLSNYEKQLISVS